MGFENLIGALKGYSGQVIDQDRYKTEQRMRGFQMFGNAANAYADREQRADLQTQAQEHESQMDEARYKRELEDRRGYQQAAADFAQQNYGWGADKTAAFSRLNPQQQGGFLGAHEFGDAELQRRVSEILQRGEVEGGLIDKRGAIESGHIAQRGAVQQGLQDDAQAHDTSERIGTQEFRSGEADRQRNWQTSERVEGQQFASGEAEKERGWRTSERVAGDAADLDRAKEYNKSRETVARIRADMELAKQALKGGAATQDDWKHYGSMMQRQLAALKQAMLNTQTLYTATREGAQKEQYGLAYAELENEYTNLLTEYQGMFGGPSGLIDTLKGGGLK